MTDDRIMELIKESPASQGQIYSLLKVIYAMSYILEKTTSPSEELTKEAYDHAEKVVSKQVDVTLQKYKEEHMSELEMYDKMSELFKM